MTDEELLAHLAAGGPRQRSALERLYHGKGREFGRFFVSRGLGRRDAEGRQDADEVLHDTILKILENAASFRGQGPANAWMWAIARNALDDHYRRQAAGQKVMQELKVRADIASQVGQGSSRKPGLDEQQHAQAENDAPATGPESSRLAEDCFTKGLKQFKAADPERGYVIDLLVEDFDIQEIADRIGRTYIATKEYVSQCRRRFAPFIEHCLPLLHD